MNYKTNQIMYWGGQKITDHNRSALDESFELVQRKARMAGGRLRSYTVAAKKNWSCSWEDIPSHNNIAASATVDGGMAGKAMHDFYLSNLRTPFAMQLRDGQGNVLTYSVMISEFTRTIKKRGNVDLWDISVTLEEV